MIKDFIIRDGKSSDVPSIRELFPLLASFDVPETRNPEDLWRSDEAMLMAWARGERDDVFVRVAQDGDTLLGITMTSLREELLSHEPSAHLEAIVVAQAAQGRGVGPRLMTDAEVEAKNRGAKSLTLHVFGTNQKARRMYAKLGYQAELLRCIKHL